MAKGKEFTVKINNDDIVYSSISKSNDGYSMARLVAKPADKMYMTVSAEWEGTNIPDFAMNLMGFMKASNMEKSGVCPGKEDLYKEYLNKENIDK